LKVIFYIAVGRHVLVKYRTVLKFNSPVYIYFWFLLSWVITLRIFVRFYFSPLSLYIFISLIFDDIRQNRYRINSFDTIALLFIVLYIILARVHFYILILIIRSVICYRIFTAILFVHQTLEHILK